MHVTDWLPTLYSAAGGNAADLGDLDGLSQWDALTTNGTGPRREILHNIDPISDYGALRVGDFKLLVGNPGIDSGHTSNCWVSGSARGWLCGLSGGSVGLSLCD